MTRICFFIILSCFSSGCLPAIFTAATGSTLVAAKDQSLGEFVDDVKISSNIKSAFLKNNFRELYTKIKVEVEQATVLLTGVIDNEEEALKAVEICWQQKGVKEVINELQINKNSSHFDLPQYTKDSMITAQIKTKTLFKPHIKFANYTVVTVNNIVYLFGLARSEEELETVASIASKIKGVEKVICHARIVDIPIKANDNNIDNEI